MNEYKKKQITHKIFSVIYAIILLFIGITEGKSTTMSSCNNPSIR